MSRSRKKSPPTRSQRPTRVGRGGGRVGPGPSKIVHGSRVPKGIRQVIGLHSCREVLSVRPGAVEKVLLRSDHERSQDLTEFADWAKRARVKVEVRSSDSLDQLGSGHQGVCLWVNEDPTLDWESLKNPGPQMLLALDGVEDPHNLGAIMRTAWLMGVKGMLVPELRASHLTPTVCKVASGAAEHVPLDVHVNLQQALEQLKERGFWVYGMSAHKAGSLWQLELPEKVVWVIGSEGRGMRVPVERACDELVYIPQAHSEASYNASVAAAIAMSEAQRQWQKAPESVDKG